jgi:hypothetical protein
MVPAGNTMRRNLPDAAENTSLGMRLGLGMAGCTGVLLMEPKKKTRMIILKGTLQSKQSLAAISFWHRRGVGGSEVSAIWEGKTPRGEMLRNWNCTFLIPFFITLDHARQQLLKNHPALPRSRR